MKLLMTLIMSLLLSVGIAGALPPPQTIVNGGFDDGLNGWMYTQGVEIDPSLGAARLQVLDFPEGIPVISLWQDLLLTSPGTISFDVKFDNGAPRDLPPGIDPGQPNYFQATYLPVDPSLDQIFLMGYDVNGPYDENLNPLPGTPDQYGWYHFTGAIGGAGTLYLELYDRGDAFSSIAWVDNVVLGEVTIPEPSTMILLGAGMAGLALIRRRSR